VKEIKRDVLKYCKEWAGVDENKIKAERMTGITNVTYQVKAEGTDAPTLLYRKFGESEKSTYLRYSDVFLERKEEDRIYKTLSDLGVGPKIYYADEKFRL
jgi:hypothetical protein